MGESAGTGAVKDGRETRDRIKQPAAHAAAERGFPGANIDARDDSRLLTSATA